MHEIWDRISLSRERWWPVLVSTVSVILEKSEVSQYKNCLSCPRGKDKSAEQGGLAPLGTLETMEQEWSGSEQRWTILSNSCKPHNRRPSYLRVNRNTVGMTCCVSCQEDEFLVENVSRWTCLPGVKFKGRRPVWNSLRTKLAHVCSAFRQILFLFDDVFN